MRDYFETRAGTALDEVLMEIGGSLSTTNHPYMVLRLDHAMQILGEADPGKVSTFNTGN